MLDNIQIVQSYLDHHVATKEVKKIHRQYILSDGFHVEIDDYSAVGNDDAFYNKYGYGTILRRGTVCVHANGQEHWLFGLPKFGYDTLDTKTGEDGTTWYFTTKENGECGHVAFLDDTHVIIGSKNVHIVLGLGSYDDDLKMYCCLNETRLEYAIRIARLLQNQLWNASLVGYMLRERLVIIIEALFNNHIVFYGAEGYRVTAFVRHGDVLSPMLTARLCSMYQLPIVEMMVASNQDEYDVCSKMFTQCDQDSEGAVVYKQSSSGKVELFKVKHPVYVAKRAARELIKRRASKQRWNDRMNDLHVHVEGKLLNELYCFYLWLLHTLPTYTADDIQDRFAILWKEYQDAGSPVFPDIVKDDRNTSVHVIGFVGIPGCGKSTISKAFECGLSKKGMNVTRINQDELCKNRKQFLARLQQLSQTQKEGYILVDKVNHTPHLRKDVEMLFANVTWVVFDAGQDDIVELCMERIRHRGIYHPSMVYSQKTREVLNRFREEMQTPSGENVCTLKMQDPIIVQLHHLYANMGIEPDLECTITATNKTIPSVLYWKIDLSNGKHVTLVYQPSSEDTKALLPYFGKDVEVHVEYILKTDRVRVASVRKTPFLDEHCKNVYPHITLWTADGVKPFEANAAFTSPTAIRENVSIEESVYKGIITVELK